MAVETIKLSEHTICLVGNPNTGQSVIFGRLTGKYVIVSNYPGTTVEIPEGQRHSSRREAHHHRYVPGTNTPHPDVRG